MRETLQDHRLGLEFEGISRTALVRHVFTTRDREGGGNLSLSGGRDRDAALAERAFWSGWLGVDATAWVVGGQVHGGKITRVDESYRGRGATDAASVIAASDGLITTTPGLPLYIAVADCAAVLIVAPGPVAALGVFHAGWRGLAAGILAHGAEQVAAAAGCGVGDLLAGVSPCIGLNSFAVGAEVTASAPDPRCVKFGSAWHVDLPGWASDQLREAGLQQGNIEASGLDSRDRPDLLFSFRRDGEGGGRNGLVAVLNPRS